METHSLHPTFTYCPLTARLCAKQSRRQSSLDRNRQKPSRDHRGLWGAMET